MNWWLVTLGGAIGVALVVHDWIVSQARAVAAWCVLRSDARLRLKSRRAIAKIRPKLSTRTQIREFVASALLIEPDAVKVENPTPGVVLVLVPDVRGASDVWLHLIESSLEEHGDVYARYIVERRRS